MHGCGSGTRQTFGWTPNGAFCFLFSQCLWSVIYTYMQTALYPLCHWKLFLILGGENSQPHLVSHQYSGLQIWLILLFCQNSDPVRLVCSPSDTMNADLRNTFLFNPPLKLEGGCVLCVSTRLCVCVHVCVCLLARYLRVRNIFGWYVVDRALSAKITWFTFGQEPDLGCLPSNVFFFLFFLAVFSKYSVVLVRRFQGFPSLNKITFFWQMF